MNRGGQMEGLKKKRLEKKLSRRAFAEIMGVSPESINQYERGVREPSFELLRKFKEFFNCTIDDLM